MAEKHVGVESIQLVGPPLPGPGFRNRFPLNYGNYLLILLVHVARRRVVEFVL